MPTVSEAARVTTRAGAVWRNCASCGRLSAMAPEMTRCDVCAPAPVRPVVAPNGMRARRRAVAVLAASGIGAARRVYTTVPADAVRVAALVEISAAAAALARTVVRLRHLDPDLIAPLVSDRTDLRAVLGRGRWLPTMCRHVPEPSSEPVDLGTLLSAVLPAGPARRRVVRRRNASGQAALFASVQGRG